MIEDAAASRDVRAFLAGNVVDIARGILGWRLTTVFDGEATEIVISEVEAYGGADDPASHAYRGRTARNGSMFREPGTLYVYRSYGVHWCANVVTGPVGEPSAVLLRAGVPDIGMEAMESRRGRSDHTADGPGKLCTALGINGDHDGTSLVDGPVRLVGGALRKGTTVDAELRVGISKAIERPWRFLARSASRSSLPSI